MSRARVTKSTQAKAARDERRLQRVARTADGYQNFAAQLGLGTSNALSASTYGFNPITRVRTLLEWIHRGSWLGGVAVDVPADDMTREGIEINGDMEPEAIDDMQAALTELSVWESLADGTRWGGLYGGAIGVYMIDGQDVSTPLRLETVGRGKFKGLMIMDRWMVDAQLTDLVSQMGPDIGKPQWYRVNSDAPCFHGNKIHYSRVMRFEGIKVPYWQRVMENLWGVSVYERLYDRMVAFDSSTMGAAQLVYKSFIRTYKLDGLREAISEGGDAELGITKQVEMMRRFQSNEGITVIDGKDDFVTHSNAGFAGIGDALIQFGQQIAGALQIPLVRLFGQSPAGLNSTGESDLRTYYDGIKQRQKREYRAGLRNVLQMVSQSEGIELSDNFSFDFRPLWQLTEQQKSEVAQRDAQTVEGLEAASLISQRTALMELRQHSKITGRFTNITDEDIQAASEDITPPDMGELGTGEGGENINAQGAPTGEEPPKEAGKMLKPKAPRSGKQSDPKDPKSAGDSAARIAGERELAVAEREYEALALRRNNGENLQVDLFRAAYAKIQTAYNKINAAKSTGDTARTADELRDLPTRNISVAGYPVTIETPKGAVRAGTDEVTDTPWSVVMPCDYGYIRGTGSAEGSIEELDCLVGPHSDSREIYVVDTCCPHTREFDEHKLLLGFRDQREALDCFRAAYDDGSGVPPASRVMGVTRMSADELRLREWIYGGDKTRPLSGSPKLVASR